MEKQNEIDEQIEEQEEEYVDCENCQNDESIMTLDGRDLCHKCIQAMNIQDMEKKPRVGFPTLKKK